MLRRAQLYIFRIRLKIHAGSVGCNTLVYVIHFDNTTDKKGEEQCHQINFWLGIKNLYIYADPGICRLFVMLFFFMSLKFS